MQSKVFTPMWDTRKELIPFDVKFHHARLK